MKIMRKNMCKSENLWCYSIEDNEKFLNEKFINAKGEGVTETTFSSTQTFRLKEQIFQCTKGNFEKDSYKKKHRDLEVKMTRKCFSDNFMDTTKTISHERMHNQIMTQSDCLQAVERSSFTRMDGDEGEEAELEQPELETVDMVDSDYGIESVKSDVSFSLENHPFIKRGSAVESETGASIKSPPFKELSTKIEDALKGKKFEGIVGLKDSMRIKMYSKIFNENYILEQIDAYKEFGRKKEAIIKKQRRLIDQERPKKVKKPTIHKKHFYINFFKPRKQPSVKEEKKMSDVTEQIQPIEPETEVVEKPEMELGENVISEEDECAHEEDSLSCPSETGPDDECCHCTERALCTCNELARFSKFIVKYHERTESRKKYELKKCDVSSSSSSCSIVRPCHCWKSDCGCERYRDYLRYKLFQVRSRKRKRVRKRAQLLAKLNEIIKCNYEVDEYDQKVLKFIEKFYVKPSVIIAINEECCKCGIYECGCKIQSANVNESAQVLKKESSEESSGELIRRASELIPSTSSILKIPKYSSEHVIKHVSVQNIVRESKPKLKFGGGDSVVPKPVKKKQSIDQNCVERMTTEECVSISGTGQQLCIVKRKEPEGTDVTNLLDVIEKSNSYLNYYVKDRQDQDQTEDLTGLSEEFGSFDYKRFMVAEKCDCKTFQSYYEKKKKRRRVREKKYPLLKYLRKRISYMSQLEEAKQMMEHTSSETDSPFTGPLSSLCDKYRLNNNKSERKKKLFKKKTRKLEKKVLFEIIKKGNHIHPCVCSDVEENCIGICLCVESCDKLQVKHKKPKIEPSIGIEYLKGVKCISGSAGTFPPCPHCMSTLPARITPEVVEPNIQLSDSVHESPYDKAEDPKGDEKAIEEPQKECNEKEPSPEVEVREEKEKFKISVRASSNKKKKSLSKGRKDRFRGNYSKHAHFPKASKLKKLLIEKSKKSVPRPMVRGSKSLRSSKAKAGKHESEAGKHEERKKHKKRGSETEKHSKLSGLKGKKKGSAIKDRVTAETKRSSVNEEACPQGSEPSRPPAADVEVSIFRPQADFHFSWL